MAKSLFELLYMKISRYNFYLEIVFIHLPPIPVVKENLQVYSLLSLSMVCPLLFVNLMSNVFSVINVSFACSSSVGIIVLFTQCIMFWYNL